MFCLEACFVLWSWFTVPVNVTLLRVPLSQQRLPTGVLLEGQEVRIRLWGPQEARLHMPSLEQAHGSAVHGLGWLVLCSGKCAELIKPNRQIQVGGPILVRRPAGSNSPLRFK